MKQQQRIALLSVYDKTGIADFARSLIKLGFEIISSGGTAKAIAAAGLKVADVAELTDFEPFLDHRVATLHPAIHAGLLAEYTDKHRAEMKEKGYKYIDLVCVDFYPLEEAVHDPNATAESVIEKTDIGGPTMIRSAAKGRRIVICDPTDRMRVIEWLLNGEPDSEQFKDDLAAKAEYEVSRYCGESAKYHGGDRYLVVHGEKAADCRYGENPWQKKAAVYSVGSTDPLAFGHWKVVKGNSGYVNYTEVDRLLQTATHIAAGFDRNFKEVSHIAIAVKHGNCCGVGYDAGTREATRKMIEGDPRAIFGGSIMVTFPIDAHIASMVMNHMSAKKRPLDVIVGPSFTEEAISMLSRDEGRCKMIEIAGLAELGEASIDRTPRVRQIRGAIMRQQNYDFILDLNDPDVVVHSNKRPILSRSQKKGIILAWAIGSTSNSNTITVVKDGKLLGNGIGQTDRVGSAGLAVAKALEPKIAVLESEGGPDDAAPEDISLDGAVGYSDSFFPFVDGPTTLINAGVYTIFSSSGSVNDQKVINGCRNRGATLVLAPDAKCRGFFGH